MLKITPRIYRRVFPIFLVIGLMACNLFTPRSTPESTPNPTRSEPSTFSPAATASAPGPLAAVWDDRSPFEAALTDQARADLKTLPGASIYHIDLIVGDDLNHLTGKMEVRFTNTTGSPLEEIVFRLFPNLYGGLLETHNLRVDGTAPQARLAERNSTLEITLPQPLAPGRQALVSMNFDVVVPTDGSSNYNTFSAAGDVLALAQYYPLIPSFGPNGWYTSIPSENADITYSDAAFYLVRVSAPRDWTLAGSGVEIEKHFEGERQLVTFAAGPARDDYLVASPHYARASLPAGDVAVNGYASSGQKESLTLALDTAARAIEIFSHRFGNYPYTEMDVAATMTSAFGVEYPGITAINTRLFDPQATFSGASAAVYLESTVAHEVGHQWFYNLVGNDQVEEPWLDEAVTQYATYLYFVDRYGQANAEGFRQSFYDRWDRVDRKMMPIGLPAGAYDGVEYGAIVYGRGPLFIEALSEWMGAEVFDGFMRKYVDTYRWKNADAAGFKALAEQECGCDLKPLFDEWVYPQ